MDLKIVLFRLILATVIGGAVGYERGFKHRPAGLRTHILVCLGAAIISLIQEATLQQTINLVNNNNALADAIKIDFNRLGAQVITGVGFLGAGTILHERGSIRGLTTAASLWVVACIGLAVGSGYIGIAILGGLFTVLVLVTFKKVETKFIDRGFTIKIEILYSDRQNAIENIERVFNYRDVLISNIETSLDDTYSKDTSQFMSLYTIQLPKYMEVKMLLHDLMVIEQVHKVSII